MCDGISPLAHVLGRFLCAPVSICGVHKGAVWHRWMASRQTRDHPLALVKSNQELGCLSCFRRLRHGLLWRPDALVGQGGQQGQRTLGPAEEPRQLCKPLGRVWSRLQRQASRGLRTQPACRAPAYATYDVNAIALAIASGANRATCAVGCRATCKPQGSRPRRTIAAPRGIRSHL